MADRPKGYGMTAEIQERVSRTRCCFEVFVFTNLFTIFFCFCLQLDAKYDAGLEAQAREWMELVVEEPFPEGSFQEALKDGTYLCK